MEAKKARRSNVPYGDFSRDLSPALAPTESCLYEGDPLTQRVSVRARGEITKQEEIGGGNEAEAREECQTQSLDLFCGVRTRTLSKRKKGKESEKKMGKKGVSHGQICPFFLLLLLIFSPSHSGDTHFPLLFLPSLQPHPKPTMGSSSPQKEEEDERSSRPDEQDHDSRGKRKKENRKKSFCVGMRSECTLFPLDTHIMMFP